MKKKLTFASLSLLLLSCLLLSAGADNTQLTVLPGGWHVPPDWMNSSNYIYPVTKGSQTAAKLLVQFNTPWPGCDREIDSNYIAVSPGDVVYESAWFWTESSTIADSNLKHGAAMGVDPYSFNGDGRICEVDPQNGVGTPDRVNGVYGSSGDIVHWGSGAWIHMSMLWTVPASLSSDGFGVYPLDQTVAPTGFIAWITGESSNAGHERAAIYVWNTTIWVNPQNIPTPTPTPPPSLTPTPTGNPPPYNPLANPLAPTSAPTNDPVTTNTVNPFTVTWGTIAAGFVFLGLVVENRAIKNGGRK
jgi:hypothetical protein